MSLRKQLAMMVIGAGVLAAQKEPPKQCEPPPGSVRKILLVNQPAAHVAELAKGLGLCATHDYSRQVAVSGPAASIHLLEETLKKPPVPTEDRDVEFVGYLLLASTGNPDSEPLPAVLNPVIEQLRPVFPYKSYRLLDILVVRKGGDSRIGFVSTSLPMLKAADTGQKGGARCDLRFSISPAPSVPGGRIFFQELRLTINDGDGNSLEILTSTSIRDGQKVVIGKANGAKLNQTFFLVASARLVD
ncbi:MAG: hypothetical protein ACKV22_30635 [Bryobacteraceae bacterium]